ncbi:MAG: hypothetical protein Q8922_09865 [Bacteroidota bacterium]|nr:hypothetical protein [Bacteroidota bacterium]MDP4232861.1 hypothetical protein [Bacteroidota bacterium]MDP4241905.1 hypothetical protein [Bacteroidota bacterium]MDP4288230.1 hypothetical protein [Bacteroidota bacterium]
MSSETPRTGLIRFAPAAYSALLVVAAILSRFAVLSNDSFPLRWQADHLSLGDPATFYNGFFPVGYPLLLRIAGFTREPFAATEIIQALIAGFYAILAIRLFERFLGKMGVWTAIVVVLLNPSAVRAALSVTPDFLAALAALLAFLAISKRDYGIAGIALGIGALLRTHMLVMIAAFAIAVLIFERDQGFRQSLRLCLAALPIVLLQGLVQAWSGHGMFESSQTLNVYRMMYGIDWNHPPAILDSSMFALVASDPLRFFSAYLSHVLSVADYLLPILVLGVWQFRTGSRDSRLMVLLTASILYLAAITVGYSPRAVLPIWPVAVLAIVLLARGLAKRVLPTGILQNLQMRPWIPAVLLAIVGAGVIEIFLGANHAAMRVREYESIERDLGIRSTEEAKRIYTDDFGLYFPNLYDATPRTSGGWAEVGLPRYLREQQHIIDSSADSFRESLLQASIRTAIFAIPPFNARAYAIVISDTGHYRFQFRTVHEAVYAIH